HPARAADSLAAVVLEMDRLLSFFDELFIEDVEHLQERGVGTDVAHLVALEAAFGSTGSLPPDVKSQIHLYDLVANFTSSNSSGSLCRRGSLSRPVNSHAATYRNLSSLRIASPSGVWYSTRKCPPHDSSRCRASMHINSASSKKSATRPAFSRA